VHYACNPAFVPAAGPAIVNVMPGVSKAALCRAARGDADIFASGDAFTTPTIRHKGATIWPLGALMIACLTGGFRRRLPRVFPLGSKMNRVRIAAAPLPAGLLVRLLFAAAAILLALLSLPQAGHAQGIVRGAQEGAHEGNRIAGPVGGVVGGAVGAGVGGAVGAVEGVLGIPHRHYRHCRGYYDGYPRFHCYR
jgi:hypothetical protein